MRTVPHLVVAENSILGFIHSSESAVTPEFIAGMPRQYLDTARTIVARSNATPGAVAAMATVVRLLERSVEAEDTPEGFELYMLADLDAALTKLRGL